MASFSPFKDHIIKELDELIQRYSLKGPFLDAGCGLGDVALHLSKKGWAGFAVDMSEVALETARSELAHVSSVEVISGNLLNLAELLKGAIVETVVMFDVLEHLTAGRFDIDLIGLDAEGRHEIQGIVVGFSRCGESRQGIRLDVFPGQFQGIHGPCGDNEGVRGIQTAGNTDDDIGNAGRFQPFGQPLYLYIIGFVASLIPL